VGTKKSQRLSPQRAQRRAESAETSAKDPGFSVPSVVKAVCLNLKFREFNFNNEESSKRPERMTTAFCRLRSAYLPCANL